MKILFIGDNLYYGGKERRLLTIIKGLVKNKGMFCDLVILKDLVNYDYIYELPVNLYIIKRRIRCDPSVFLKLFKICLRSKPDIIHSWGSLPSLYVIPIAKILRIKFINAMVANAFLKPFSKQWFRAKITFPFSDIILTNSYAGISVYNIPLKKGVVIYNGFDFSRLDKSYDFNDIKESLQIKSKFIIGMIGSLDERKDFLSYIMAAQKLLKKNYDICFLIVGDGEKYNELYNKIEPVYLNMIRFLGLRKDIDAIISILDIGVLMTNENKHSEGISNVILEYMAHGKPVIASEGGGTAEIIINNETGYIIPPFSINILANKIEYLLENPGIRQLLGKNGKERARKNFRMDNMVDNTLSLYCNLLKVNKINSIN